MILIFVLCISNRINIFNNMKILDLYIIKIFVKNFLFGLVCFILIFILVELFENLDKFIDYKASISILISYYLYFIPEIIKLITPVGMLLASLFTISRFVNFSELTAIKSSGISLLRFSASIFIFGVIITIFSIYFNGWIVPLSNIKKFAIERTYLHKNQIQGSIQNLYLQDTKNRILYINVFDRIQKIGYNISIQEFSPELTNKIIWRIDARNMVWDNLKNDWKLNDFTYRKIMSENKEIIVNYREKYITDIPEIGKININPTFIEKSDLRPEELILSDLKDFITNTELSGLNTSKLKVDYYSIISFPFANIVTIFFGISLSLNKRRGGAALQFGISILLSFIYLGFVRISQVFGYNGDFPPLLTAWLANIIFFSVSIINFIRVQRN